MNANSVPRVSASSPVLEIRQAIAQAHNACQAHGANSEACSIAWETALTLQLEKFNQQSQHRKPNP